MNDQVLLVVLQQTCGSFYCWNRIFSSRLFRIHFSFGNDTSLQYIYTIKLMVLEKLKKYRPCHIGMRFKNFAAKTKRLKFRIYANAIHKDLTCLLPRGKIAEESSSTLCAQSDIQCWEKYAHSSSSIEQVSTICSQIKTRDGDRSVILPLQKHGFKNLQKLQSNDLCKNLVISTGTALNMQQSRWCEMNTLSTSHICRQRYI